MRSYLPLGALGLAILSSCCSAGPGEGGRMESAAIIGGSPATADTSVVAVVEPSAATLCSGTLVAPNVVLTAAHCVFEVSASKLQVLVGSDTSNPDQTVAVSATSVYPTYTGEASGLAGGVDLAVVYLATPLSLSPVPVNATATDGELSKAALTLVGFGVSDTADTNQVGVRLSVTTPVVSVCSRLLTIGSSDANVCSGDSGGAALLGGALVAVVSSGSPDCSAPSNLTRLSAHSLWLSSVLEGDAVASCSACVAPDPSCTAATETEPAGSSGDAGGDAAGDAASPTNEPKGGHSGGCDVGAASSSGALEPWLSLLGLALLRGARRGCRPAR